MIDVGNGFSNPVDQTGGDDGVEIFSRPIIFVRRLDPWHEILNGFVASNFTSFFNQSLDQRNRKTVGIVGID